MYEFIGTNLPLGSRRDLIAAERQAVRRSLLLGLLMLAAFICGVMLLVGDAPEGQVAMGFIGP